MRALSFFAYALQYISEGTPHQTLFFPPSQTLDTFPKQLIKWESFIHSTLSFLHQFVKKKSVNDISILRNSI